MNTFLAFRTAVFTPRQSPQAFIRFSLGAVRNAHATTNAGKYLKNEKIPHPIVRLVEADTGRLASPTAIRNILASIDRKVEYVELVSSDPEPVVKIINKQEAFEKRKQAKLKAREVVKRNVQKEVQFTWGAAAGDLAHKLKRVRQELEKGSRVDLVFTSKKGQVVPTQSEIRARLQEVMNEFADVGKEWKPRQIQKTTAVLLLQGLSHQIMADSPSVPASPPEPKPLPKPKSKPKPVGDGIQDLYQD